MQVLIFEPKYVGHFLGFAAVTAKAFAHLSCHVTLMFPQDAKGTDQARIKLADLPENVEVRFSIDVPKRYERWVNAKFESKALTVALDEGSIDHLVVPSGDFLLSGLLKSSKLRRRLRSLGGVDFILHNCQQVYPEIGIKQRCKCLLDQLAISLARGIRLHTVDPFATSSATVSRMSLFGNNSVHPLPHFLEVPADSPSQHDARAGLDLPTEGRMLGSIGDLGRRKGTELLIKSFVRSKPQPDQYLALFGLLSGTAKAELEKHRSFVDRGQIICRDRFVSDEDFYNFFYAMDALWAGFPHQVGIASTQLHAAIAGRPVIASDYGAVGWLTKKYGLGRAFPGNLEAMTNAITWFHQTEDFQPDPAGLRRLLDYHTTENFNKQITYALRKRMEAASDRSTAPNEAGAQ